jgi:dipeptidyl-peptidase-3
MAIGYLCPCCGVKVARDETNASSAPSSSSSSSSSNKDNVLLGMPLCQPCGQAPKASPPDMSVHTLPLDTPVVALDATKAFALLTAQEQQYAYALSQADWQGAKICLLQCSVESVPIFTLLQLVFSSGSDSGSDSGSPPTLPTTMDELKAAAKAKGLTDTEIAHAMLYAATFYGNLGNYKSFGDTKFVPALPPDRMYTFLTSSQADAAKIDALWEECGERMYSLTPRQRQMGLGATKGISTYFSANCTEADAALANSFLDSIGLSAYNTRLFKDDSDTDTDTGNCNYIIRLASSTTDDYPGKSVHTYRGNTQFTIQRGDYAPIMGRVVQAVQDAIPHAANPTQTKMLEHYVTSFTEGSIDAHKDASRQWIRDTGPAVESYIGFIESYRDPSGVRGEWEGFVSCVNKEVSRKFQALVNGAEGFLEKMPWPKAYEKDTFLRPDFTSLEVLSFGSSGVPAGINIPNYDDIRQSEGFKNVSLGNVLQASYSVSPDKKVSFVAQGDQELYKKLKGDAFEVQVGIHELLGHGSGKLYHVGTPDAEALTGQPHPLTGEPITGPFYAPGATWGSTFGKISPTYEECRAECSGLFLCLEAEILEVFGVIVDDDDACKKSKILDVSYINWLLMARAGLTGLEFYTPETKEWRQAHMQARYVILRLLLQAEDGKLLSLHQLPAGDSDDGKPDVEIHLDRELISTVGRKVVGDFLLKLQVYKSLGDVENGAKFYNSYSEVPEDMAKLREIVMARKEPRKLLIQPNLHKTGEDDGSSVIQLQTFPCTPEGMVESFVARFPSEDPELMALYEADKAAMTD